MSIVEMATFIASIAQTIALIFAIVQIREMKEANFSSAFKMVYDVLQSDEIRSARKTVLETLKNKPLIEWTMEDKWSASKVCQSYDVAGLMIKNGLLPLHIVADSWGDSLRKSYPVLKMYLEEVRIQRNSGEFWDDFEWLCFQSLSFQKKIREDTKEEQQSESFFKKKINIANISTVSNTDNQTMNDKSINLVLLQNHSNLRTGQDQVLWSIFGAFWTANSLLLVSIFTADETWNTAFVGIVISTVGLSISGVWAFIQKRALKRLEIYENAIKAIEKDLDIPFSLCAFYNENEINSFSKKINARTVMVLFSYLSILSWAISLLTIVVFSIVQYWGK